MRLNKQWFVLIGLLALVLFFIQTNAHAEFNFLDNVLVVKGFYMGNSGAVQEKVGDNKYRVKLLPVGKIIIVSEDEIQLSMSGSQW